MIPTVPLIEIAIGLTLIGAGSIWAALIATSKPDPNAWIDARIAAERDPGRRNAWRTIRDRNEEGL